MATSSAIRVTCKKSQREFALGEPDSESSVQPEINNGVYCFDSERKAYGNPSPETIRYALKEKDSISPMVKLAYIADKNNSGKTMALRLGEPRRVAPLAWIDPEKLSNATVLDYGCGLGPFSMTLANLCGQLCSVDADFERAMFARANCTHLGYGNVVVANGSLDSDMFFSEGQFDLIVLNGVLEWIPYGMEGDPRDIQLETLRKLKSLLKPDGVLYVAIENRVAWNYFLGKKDDHSGLKFTSFMPRPVADWYCRKKKGEGYRTYTYSFSGYNKLFNEAGLQIDETICLHPDYRYPQHASNRELYPDVFRNILNDTKKTSKRAKVLAPLSKLPFSTSVLKRTPHSFGFFVSTSGQSSLVSNEPKRFYITQDGYLREELDGVFEYSDYSPGIWGDSAAALGVQKTVRTILEASGETRLAAIIPAMEEVDGAWREQIMPGVEVAKTFREGGSKTKLEEDFGIALKQLASIYSVTQSAEAVSFSEPFKRWKERCFDCYYFDDTADLLDAVEQELNARCSGIVVHASPIHGNFSAKNILKSNGEITGIVDWSMAEANGVVEVDVIDSLICHLRFVLGIKIDTDFFSRLEALHKQYADEVSGVLPLSDNKGLYFFSLVRNVLLRGRGCFLRLDELKLVMGAWKSFQH